MCFTRLQTQSALACMAAQSLQDHQLQATKLLCKRIHRCKIKQRLDSLKNRTARNLVQPSRKLSRRCCSLQAVQARQAGNSKYILCSARQTALSRPRGAAA